MNSNIKKLVISKTIMFLLATVFIVIFKMIFGEDNVLIGVSSFIAMLLFMGRDLTGHILKYTVTFVAINLIMGIGICIVHLNMFIGIPINFILVFLIGYYFCQDLKKPVYLPFMLQYVFLLSSPISISGEGKRLLSLFVGALLIMIPQLLFNMKKLQKESKKTFIDLSKLLIKKIDLIVEEKDVNEVDNKITTLVNSLKENILDRKDKDCNISSEGESSLNILVCLQKLDERISKKAELTNEIISYVKEGLTNFEKSLGKEVNYKDFILDMERINTKYKNDLGKDVNSIQILNSFRIIQDRLSGLKIRNYKNEKVRNENKFSISKFIIENKDGVGFSYGVRAGIGIAITCFIAQFFHLQEGQWMTVTVYSLVNPIYEVSKYKSKDRVVFTFLGAIVVIILLTIFKGEMERTLLLLFVGYIMTYVSQYKYTIFFATICIVAMTTGSGNVLDFAAQRFGYVIIGFCVALLLNKFVLRKDLEKINLTLKEKYKNIIRGMLEEIYDIANGKEIKDTKVEKKFLTASLIENKIKENYNVALISGDSEIELRNRILAIDTFSLYIGLKEKLENNEYLKLLIRELKLIEKGTIQDFNLDIYNNKIKETDNMGEKIIYADIYEIGQLIN